MRAFLITALLATAQCYGPPQQPSAPAAGSASAPTGLTEFCGTNCIQQKQPPVHQQQPIVAPQPQPQQPAYQPQQPAFQPQQPAPQPQQPPPNYSNNPFLNGAVNLNSPPPAAPVQHHEQQPSYQQQQVVQQQQTYPQQPQIVEQKPNYANNPFLTGQVVKPAAPAAGAPCREGALCVARAMCASGVLRQEDVLQAKSQNQPCVQARGEVCCRVPDLIQQQGAPSLVVQRPVDTPRFPPQQQSTSTYKPYTGPQNTTPHVGCAAALVCVALEYCTAAGVASDAPVAIARDDTRVPLSECVHPETGIYGFCCRDPNYKDPWPETQEICDQGTSCEAMWKCPGERMALPKKGCRVVNDGSTGICCLPPRGAPQQQFPSQQFPQQQQQFPQQSQQFNQFQQQQVAANVIDNRPAYATSVISQQPLKPQPVVAANVPPPPPSKPFNPPPRPFVQPAPPPPVPVQPQYPVDPPPRPFVPTPQPSYPTPQPSYPSNPPQQVSQTQFFQQQSPANNQFPIQQIKVPAQQATTSRPFVAPVVAAAPVQPVRPAGPTCGIRSAAPGTPQDGESGPGEFPWQTLVTAADGARLCAGAIISETAILVSATCVQGRNANDLKIEVGSWSPYSSAQERQVAGVKVAVPHPRFDSATQANDLAVLVLQQSLRFGRFVGAVCLPRADELTPEGLLVSASGACLMSSWPKPADGASKLSRVAVQPIAPAQCEESLRSTYLGKYFQLHSSFMCAAPVDPQQTMCPVNLGGALVCPRGDGHYAVVGASSWDVGCAQPQPAVMCALDVEWVDQVLATPAHDLQQQQQQQQQFVVAPDVAQQKPGFSQGYGR
ncbi:DNA translocase FtsK-like [Neocloeon triangulifer]|uniref:DNA translocase FtsK-like n=1 Tax=Neocloeon triangulifer TaxID=2078957 RepID=UPI00286F02DA|nr:DNA translocase FtsK-like [Neocloeon triangulifer]